MTDHPLRIVDYLDQPRQSRGDLIEAALAPIGLSIGARGAYLALLGMVDGIQADHPLWIPESYLFEYFRGITVLRVRQSIDELIEAELIIRETDPLSIAQYCDFDPDNPIFWLAPHPDRAELLPKRRRGRY